MITLERSTDWETIKKVITHPRIWPAVSDDGSPPPEQWEPLKDAAAYYVLIKDNEELLGLWAFYPHNSASWEVHTCILPNAWGNRAKEAVKKLSAWVWENMPAQRITTEVPDYNRVALRFALAAGLVPYGCNPKAYQKNGKLHDVILLGISRPCQ